MRVLVSGGAGYIGSHTVLELVGQGHEVRIVDNFSNSSPIAIERLKSLTNGAVDSVEADILQRDALSGCFADFKPDAVIHFAGLKAVGESVEKPLSYYHQNIEGTVSLLETMERHQCCRIVFSSSATVYGDPLNLPIDESHRLQPTNPYGRTKYFIEELLRDWCNANSKRTSVALRYFNPVGAHPSARIGEDPNGIPNNLLPFITQVAVGRLPVLKIFGNDYDTPDGTGVRDYIHVMDLAEAHVAAINAMDRLKGFDPINLGTGKGTSVLKMVQAFENASGKRIAREITSRRPGDVAAVWADPAKALETLGWRSKRTIDDMCRSAWQWQSMNPMGYRES